MILIPIYSTTILVFEGIKGNFRWIRLPFTSSNFTSTACGQLPRFLSALLFYFCTCHFEKTSLPLPGCLRFHSAKRGEILTFHWPTGEAQTTSSSPSSCPRISLPVRYRAMWAGREGELTWRGLVMVTVTGEATASSPFVCLLIAFLTLHARWAHCLGLAFQSPP